MKGGVGGGGKGAEVLHFEIFRVLVAFTEQSIYPALKYSISATVRFSVQQNK